MPEGTVQPKIALPELDVTKENQEWAQENVPSVDGDCYHWSHCTALEWLACRERQLLSALTQLYELRAASEWVSVNTEPALNQTCAIRGDAERIICTASYKGKGEWLDSETLSMFGKSRGIVAWMDAKNIPQLPDELFSDYIPPQPSPASAVKGDTK